MFKGLIMHKKALLAFTLAVASLSAQSATLINEGFNDIRQLSSSGWIMNNTSSSAGITSWFQGDAALFQSQAGTDESYIAANLNNADTGGTISNWLISPVFSRATDVTINFWVKGAIDAGFSDQFAFGLSDGNSAVSAFSMNPEITAVGDWTNYVLNFSSVNSAANARFAIQYRGSYETSNYLGIDSFSINSVPEPSNWLTLGAGMISLMSLSAIRRRQKN